MPGKTVILARDADEAEIIKQNPLALKTLILTLSPAAAAAFIDNPKFKTVDTTKVYSDISHIRSVINLKNTQAEFKASAATIGNLSEIQVEAAANILFYISGAASFFYLALKKYSRFYIVNGKKLEELEGFENAFQTIVSGILKKRYSGREHKFSALHRWLMKTYNAHIVKKLKNKKKLVIIDGVRPSSKAFAKAALKHDPQLVILSGRNPVKSIFIALRHMLRSIRSLNRRDYFSTRVPMYFFYPAKTRSYMAEAEKIASLAKNRFSRLLLQAAKPYIAESFALSAGFEQENKKHIAALKPEIVSTDGIASGYTISACLYTKANGGKVVFFNHASHTPQTSPISKAIGNLWAGNGAVYNKTATYSAARSPAVAAIARELSNGKARTIAVRHDVRIPNKPHDKFNILFAGNYLGVQEHVPFVLETPDEFLKGIAELAAAVGQIPEAHLTIRVKPKKKDFTLDTLKKLIPSYPNVEISNQGSFKDVLAETDIMVANISTTVDEALHSGKPVLLHSWPKRYQHLPPAKNGRSAVYASEKNGNLVELLQKIIANHKDKPLTEAELSAYIWPETEADMSALAKRILDE